MPILTLTVNGASHELEIPANRFLAEVLRYDLGLTGTKIGCNEAECGACTVPSKPTAPTFSPSKVSPNSGKPNLPISQSHNLTLKTPKSGD
jgi:hypothetical protein